MVLEEDSETVLFIDSDEDAGGFREVEAAPEPEKSRQLIEDGGYIPHLDDGWSESISYDCFLYFIELKTKIAEGRI